MTARKSGCFTLWRIFGAEKKLLRPSILLSIDSSELYFLLLSLFMNFLSIFSGRKGSMKELNFCAWRKNTLISERLVKIRKRYFLSDDYCYLLLLSVSSWFSRINKNRRGNARFENFRVFEFILIEIDYNDQVKFRTLLDNWQPKQYEF